MLKTVCFGQFHAHGAVMLLGGFDGLHIGHRALLSRAKKQGGPVGIMTIVGCKEKALFTFAEREKIFQDAGIDFVFELPFTEIKTLSPDEFLALLEKEFSPRSYVCGDDFRFGAGAVGTAQTLKENTQVCVEIVELLRIDGEKISSTSIKKALKEGDLAIANALLGEEFFLMGEVVKDRQIGRTLQFPTANIHYPKDKFPMKQGVYQTWAEIDGKIYQGITNFGARPTFNDESVLTETHFIGFNGDLYGKTLTLHFTRFLREIIKFDDVAALKAQLMRDVEEVKNEN